MNKFIPDMYQKSIYTISYKKLKEKGIKVLLFDFDNTIIEQGNYSLTSKTIKLFNDLKKDFIIYIVSNSIQKNKLKKVCGQIDIPYIKDSRKPFKKGFKKLKFKSIKENQIAMIGDQIITDVLGSNRMNYYSILIDPINNKEWLLTKINRLFENIILKKINVKRGNYYD